MKKKKLFKQNLEVEEMMQDENAFMSSSRIRRSPVKKSQATGNLQNTSVRRAGIEKSGMTKSVQEGAQSD